MTIGPTGTGERLGTAGDDPRSSFDLLARLAARCEVSELSMGMSGDYELAVSMPVCTIVRDRFGSLGGATLGPVIRGGLGRARGGP